MIGFVEFLIKRRDSRNDKTAELTEALTSLRKEISEARKDTAEARVEAQELYKGNRREIARLQLTFLTQTNPKNKDTILTLADKYFNELDGNAEMHSLINKWGKDNDIDVSWFNQGYKKQ